MKHVHVITFATNASLTKYEVKMAEYRTRSFLVLQTNLKSRSIKKNAEKGQDQYPATLTKQPWSIRPVSNIVLLPCPTQLIELNLTLAQQWCDV